MPLICLSRKDGCRKGEQGNVDSQLWRRTFKKTNKMCSVPCCSCACIVRGESSAHTIYEIRHKSSIKQRLTNRYDPLYVFVEYLAPQLSARKIDAAGRLVFGKYMIMHVKWSIGFNLRGSLMKTLLSRSVRLACFPKYHHQRERVRIYDESY